VTLNTFGVRPGQAREVRTPIRNPTRISEGEAEWTLRTLSRSALGFQRELPSWTLRHSRQRVVGALGQGDLLAFEAALQFDRSR
jgi:hypothetical protein